MSQNSRLFLKWGVVFFILCIWTVLVVQGINFKASNGLGFVSASELSGSFNLPIYIQTDAGIEKMSSPEIINILFKHNFSSEKRNQEIPMKSCSLRASDGNVILIGNNFNNKNKLNFNLNEYGNGDGSLTAQDNKERISMSFKPVKIIRITSDSLVFSAKGRMHTDNDNIDLDMIFKLNKTSNSISISESNNFSFSAENMKITFADGCSNKIEDFILINDNGELEEERSIEEVRQLLNENPELIDAYEGLRRLFSDYWWMILPSGSGIVS
ncbi:MAG: hypothetical protein WC533_01145 [Candidatus Pacearchaeota archaeon]